MSNFIPTFLFYILFFLTTHAQENTRLDSTPNRSPYSKSIFPHATSNLKPELPPKSTHNANANANANVKFGSPQSPQKSKPIHNFIPDLAPKSSHNSNRQFGLPPSPQNSKPIHNLKPELAPKSSHDPNLKFGLPRSKPPSLPKSKPTLKLMPELAPKSSHDPNLEFGLPRSKSPSPQKSKPIPNGPSPKKSKPNPKPLGTPKSKKNATSPYQFANQFCLSRRLDVKRTFCLQVLRSGPTSTKANDNQALLGIAADAATRFGDKTIALLKKLSAEKKTKTKTKPAAVTECISAYEGYLEQFRTLVQEAQIEAQLASYDSELAKFEIDRCAKALGKTKDAEIEGENKVALDHASLAQNIADSIQ